MDGLIALAAILAILLVVGGGLGLVDRRHFRARWLIVAALLVALNDALLTSFYGALPDIIGGAWNWQGKILALVATLAIAALPALGWRNSGLTFAQKPGSLMAALPVAALYCAFFLALSLAFPGGEATGEDVAFQLTMPGLEEEPFYRGIMLLALDRAFLARRRIAGVDWGWGALLSCMLFDLAHAFGYADRAFHFDGLAMALTALPALIAVWLRLRTGSLALPIILHNFGNAIGLIV